MKWQSYNLRCERNGSLELGAQEFPCGIKHRLRPDTRYQEATVSFGHFRYFRVLLKTDQYLVCKAKYEHNRYHHKSGHEFSSVQVISTSLVSLRSETLTDISFQGAIQTLYYSEAKYIDQHVAHPNPSKNNWIIQMPNKVSVDKLHEHENKHRKYHWHC